MTTKMSEKVAEAMQAFEADCGQRFAGKRILKTANMAIGFLTLRECGKDTTEKYVANWNAAAEKFKAYCTSTGTTGTWRNAVEWYFTRKVRKEAR